MKESIEQSQSSVSLNCFEGRTAPPLVIEGWKQLRTFPSAAWEPFWLLLAPVVMNPGDVANQELIALFCKEQDISPESILAAMACCELLLKNAAALNLSIDAFQQDLEALTGEKNANLSIFILERYPEAKKGLRRQILQQSLATHGKVMTGLEWRLDKVRHSSKGNHLNTEIVLLTLHYREGQAEDKITLQLTKDAAAELKKFCERVP